MWGNREQVTHREPVQSLIDSLVNCEWHFEYRPDYRGYYIGQHNLKHIAIASYEDGELMLEDWMTKAERKAVGKELVKVAKVYVMKEKARKEAAQNEDRKQELFKLVKENA